MDLTAAVRSAHPHADTVFLVEKSGIEAVADCEFGPKSPRRRRLMPENLLQ